MSAVAGGSGEGRRESLGRWLGRQPGSVALNGIVADLAAACISLETCLRRAPLNGLTGSADQTNVQGEVQKSLDVISNDIVIGALKGNPAIAALVSEEEEHVIRLPVEPGDAYAVCFDPLDGSTNIEVNGTIGTVFSVLQFAGDVQAVDDAAVLAAARNQVAAGYVLYGPSTLMIITLGEDVAEFAHDPDSGDFRMVRERIIIPAATNEFAINAAHRRFWPEEVASYVEECLQGEKGPRGKRFNMRWAGAMVADIHRIFARGGMFIYPALTSTGGANGKLRLLYEANPMALLAERAGGLALAGSTPVSELVPHSIHQRVPLSIGSREEVERLAHLAREVATAAQ